MNLYKNLIIGLALVMLIGCDDSENDVTLPGSFDYLSFEDVQLSFSEVGGGPAIVSITRSTGNLSNELTISYVVSAPDSGRAAAEGTDYTLPAGSGAVTFPVGVATVDVPLINIIDNDDSVGNRSLKFSIDDPKGFNLGSPDFPEAGSVTLTITEDDLFTFGETSFEEVTTFVGDVTFPKRPTVEQVNTQVLVPGSTDPYVDWTRTGDELGFNASSSAENLVDLDSDPVGVLSNANMDANTDTAFSFDTRFRKGNNGYVAADLDGIWDIKFDDISIPAGTTNLVLEISYYMASTYEDQEGLFVYWETADGLGDALIFEQGPAAQIDQWIDVQVPIPASRTVDGRISVRMFNTFNPESTFIDYIAIKGIR